MLGLILLLFAQFTVPMHSGARAASGGSCTLPFSDSFAGTGALGSPCWTQSSAAGYVAMVMASGKVTSASAGSSLAFETGTGTATTQSIQAAFTYAGSGHSGMAVHADVATQNMYVWNNLDAQVYAENAGTYTLLGTTTGTVGTPTSGDVLKFSVSGTTLTCQNITHAGTNTFTVSGGNIVTSGYAGLDIDTTSNAQSYGPATVN